MAGEWFNIIYKQQNDAVPHVFDGVDKGQKPLMFIPALTAYTSKRMKTARFSYFAGFPVREHEMREGKPVKKSKKWSSATFSKYLKEWPKPLLYLSLRFDYSMIAETTPEATVRPPSSLVST